MVSPSPRVGGGDRRPGQSHDVLGGAGLRRLVHGQHGRRDRVQFRGDGRLDGVEIAVRRDAVGDDSLAQPRERLPALRLLSIARRPVVLDIAVVMTRQPDGLALEEHRAPAIAGLRNGPLRGVQHFLGVELFTVSAATW